MSNNIKYNKKISTHKNSKRWYEKINNWIGIIAGVCTILTFFFSYSQSSNVKTMKNIDNNKINIDNQTPVMIGSSNNKASQIQENDLNINVHIDNNTTISDEYVTEPFDIDSLKTASYVKILVRNKTDGYPAWNTVTSMNVGDYIEFQIEYKNTSKYEQNNIVVSNFLPENVKYVEGTLKKHDANNPNGISINPDKLFTEKGINIGSFKPGTNTYINFTVEVINADFIDGKKTLFNEFEYEIGTEKYIISKNYAYGAQGGWGPGRATYTMAEPAHQAVFNSITDNAAIGDERDFVRIAEKDAGTIYTSELIVKPDKQYSVLIYFHNNASSTFNDEDYDYIGVAIDTKVSSIFPSSLAKGEREAVSGCISSTNTDPESVWDSAFITAMDNMTLHYVPNSAKIYNSKDANKSILPTSLFSNEGTFIGTNKLDGIVPGCDEYAGMIIYTIQTMPVKNDDK